MSFLGFQHCHSGNENSWVWEDYPSTIIISKAEHGSSLRAKPASCSSNRQTSTEVKLTSCLASGWTC